MQGTCPDKKMAKYLLKKYPYTGGNLEERMKAWIWYYAAPLIKRLKGR
jgi:hypothetical protein